ncbi:LamG domain-containing protein [Clostridium sporogenes]|uniref:LamG domain-containing protein n=1 Tax=Clostridium sporogenes TaxID=1509 RepID=UPI000A847587|nr:LamG domain-containing protein [Clostridium sporogenes]MCW6122612.1 LamG domain-containing protein [Clostridium sporogenes]
MTGIDQYTKLLLHMDDNSFNDKMRHVISNNGVIFDTNNKKFGDGSAYFNSNSNLTITNNADFEFRNDSFTIDMWIRMDSLPLSNTYYMLYDKRNGNANYGSISFMVNSSGGLGVSATSDNTSWNIISNLSIPVSMIANQWYHVALIRNGNNFSIAVNGVITSIGDSSLSIATNGNDSHIGGLIDKHKFKGYMDEVRISKGIARWTSNFTPPTTPYGYNKYLIKQNNQYYTIKSEFYKNDNYEPITELEGKEILTQADFETYGIYDLDLLTQTIDTQVVNGIDKGSLGSGKYFEIELNNFIKKINSQPIPKEFEVTNDMWSNKVSLPWTNGMGNGGFLFNIVEDVYYKLQTKVLNNAKITVYFFDGTTFSDTTNYNGKVTILNNIKKINKINISGAHGGGNFTIQQFNLFKTKNIKYLIYCNNQIYSFNGKEILLSDSQFIDQNNFINNGFTNTTVITEGQWNIAFPDKSNLKLLMWTDDMSKTDVSLETEIIPFRPIDKLKKNSDICNILFKEV